MEPEETDLGDPMIPLPDYRAACCGTCRHLFRHEQIALGKTVCSIDGHTITDLFGMCFAGYERLEQDENKTMEV